MDMFSALAEPTRRSIIELLARNGELSATDIYDRFHTSHPAISQHLQVLREAKLVSVEKRAQQRIYKLAPDSMLAVEKWVKHMESLWTERLGALDNVLEEEKRKTHNKKGNRNGRQ